MNKVCLRVDVSAVNSYMAGIAVIVLLTLLCSALCYRNMGVNRGNFINLPVWRKTVKAVLNILLFCLMGVFLWKEDRNSFMLTLFGILLSAGAVGCIFLLYRVCCSVKKRFVDYRRLLSPKGIGGSKYTINKGMFEYVFYAVGWTSKGIAIVLSLILTASQFIKVCGSDGTVLTGIDQYLILPLKICAYICFAVALISAVISFILVVVEERTLYQSVEVEQVKGQIRRNFRFHEHDV